MFSPMVYPELVDPLCQPIFSKRRFSARTVNDTYIGEHGV